MHCISANGLTKHFGKSVALNHVDLEIEAGRIVGLIGPNGAGKTTLINAMLGLTPCEGTLRVLDRDPWHERAELMHDACFVSDVAVLPRWMKVQSAIDYMEAVHPKFNRNIAEGFLAKTSIRKRSKIAQLSKGMVAQLHLALAMSVDAKLLVLDEPTLGLDIFYRKQFYEALLNDYYDKERTIIVATHHIDEVQYILTDAMFMDGGRIVFNESMERVDTLFLELIVNNDAVERARAFKPVHIRHVFGKTTMLFRDVKSELLQPLGELRTPSLSDLFMVYVTNQAIEIRGGDA